MAWISNHKHKFEEKSTKSSQSSSKVVGLGLAGLWEFPTLGLSLDILKMESWKHMGRTANISIKDVIHVFASISKMMRILLMGRCNRERWTL